MQSVGVMCDMCKQCVVCVGHVWYVCAVPYGRAFPVAS